MHIINMSNNLQNILSYVDNNVLIKFGVWPH